MVLPEVVVAIEEEAAAVAAAEEAAVVAAEVVVAVVAEGEASTKVELEVVILHIKFANSLTSQTVASEQTASSSTHLARTIPGLVQA